MKTKRQSRLRERSRGLPFGQRGSLIGSIKRVLDQYPHRSDVFKGAPALPAFASIATAVSCFHLSGRRGLTWHVLGLQS